MEQKHVRAWQVVLVALSTIVACSNADGQRDGWLAYRPADMIGARTWDELPAGRYSRVTETERERAVEMLAEQPFLPLSATQMETLVAKPPEITSGQPFLIRGVRMSTDGGGFRLLSDSESLVVFYGALGVDGETAHDAVVVFLEREPAAVFVELSTAR